MYYANFLLKRFLTTYRYGHFSGINRKVQLKYQPKGRPRNSSSDDGNFISFSLSFHNHYCRISIGTQKIIINALIIKDTPKDASLLLILKWGGELTPSGRIQAEELGRVFRCMYPGGQGKNDS